MNARMHLIYLLLKCRIFYWSTVIKHCKKIREIAANFWTGRRSLSATKIVPVLVVVLIVVIRF